MAFIDNKSENRKGTIRMSRAYGATLEDLPITQGVSLSLLSISQPSSVVLTQTGQNSTQIEWGATWVNESSVDLGYVIEYRINSGSWVYLTSQAENSISEILTTLSHDDTLQIRVNAVGAEGTGKKSNTITAALAISGTITGLTITQSDPETTEITDSNSGNTLTNVDNYEYQYYGSNSGGVWEDYPESNYPSLDQVEILPGLENDEDVKIRVRGVNSQVQSDWFESNEIVINIDINEPTSVVLSQTAFSLGQFSMLATWVDNSSVETGYEIQINKNGGAFSAISTRPANAESYAFDIEFGYFLTDTVTIRIKAKTVSSESDWVESNSVILSSSP